MLLKLATIINGYNLFASKLGSDLKIQESEINCSKSNSFYNILAVALSIPAVAFMKSFLSSLVLKSIYRLYSLDDKLP